MYIIRYSRVLSIRKKKEERSKRVGGRKGSIYVFGITLYHIESREFMDNSVSKIVVAAFVNSK